MLDQLFEDNLRGNEFSQEGVAVLMISNGLDVELMPLLDPVLPFKVEDSELTTSLTSAARYSMTNQLLVDLLRFFVRNLRLWCS